MTESIYKAELLNATMYKFFSGVYNDFRLKARTDYLFELEPLEYDEFLKAIDADLLKCISLMENDIPTGFLAYTTSISEGIELNMIHFLGNDDISNKFKILMNKFLELTEQERKRKVICYPMLGAQNTYTPDISKFGFKFIGQAVLRYMMDNPQCERVLEGVKPQQLPYQYKITGWSEEYLSETTELILETFRDTPNALFDTRFRSFNGVEDIVNKIVDGIYGTFLPKNTSVLLCENKVCGIAFANLTTEHIANIPLVGISKKHRGKGYSKNLLQRTVRMMVDDAKLGINACKEINVTTETNNYKALKMYRRVGFKEDYCYPQAYLES